MPLVAHLFGSPTLSGAVGKSSANKPKDVKIVKALLNPYLRSQNQPALSMSIADSEALAQNIESFQKQKLNSPKPDGRIDPGGKALTGLIQYLRTCYTVQPIAAPTAGRLTWDAEGREGGPFHSRRLHVPDGNSGLTLGRGYDLRERIGAAVQADLANAGVVGNVAFKISTAAGKSGADASRFVIDNDLLDFEITPQVQLKLFGRVYGFMLKEVKRISSDADTVRLHGKVDWAKLDQRILDVLVDLRYRGDYTRTSRAFLQKHVANNDFAKFKTEIAKTTNWKAVPPVRFEMRKAYLEAPLHKKSNHA